MTGFPLQSVESAPRVGEFGAHGNCRTMVKTHAEEVEIDRMEFVISEKHV